MMKKVFNKSMIAVVAAAMVAMGITACGGTKEETTAAETTVEETTVEETTVEESTEAEESSKEEESVESEEASEEEESSEGFFFRFQVSPSLRSGNPDGIWFHPDSSSPDNQSIPGAVTFFFLYVFIGK